MASLKIDSTFNGIPVCSKCGWTMVGPYEVERHHDCPHITAGNLAAQLAARFPEVPSTKFGYGDKSLTFELDAKTHLQLKCLDDRFRLECLWLMVNLTTEEAAALVAAIVDWRDGCLRARIYRASCDHEISQASAPEPSSSQGDGEPR